MSRAPNTELDALIQQYEHESQRPRAKDALFMLQKIGSIVKPIMRRRSWRVGTLAEFYPAETNLLGLNINRGQKINLRLRYPGDANQFLPLEQVVDTMLHELCHNVIGPHNQEFHALWDQLRDEHEALVRKGYTGEGFLGRGERLGGGRVPLHEARRRARQAAERRRMLAAGSGQRLGGTGILRGQDARAVIADAVERRLKIEKGCASGTAAGEKIAHNENVKKEQVTTTQAGPEDENEATMMQAYIELIEEEEKEKYGGYYVPPSAANPTRSSTSRASDVPDKARSLVEQQRQIEQDLMRQKQSEIHNFKPAQSESSATSRTVTPDPPRPVPISQTEITHEMPDTWTCEVCTLVNPINFLTCDACTVERPTIFSDLQDQMQTTPSLPPRPVPSSQFNKSGREKPNALKPRSSAYDSIKRFETESVSKAASRPVGWQCSGCGNFMEQEWWTCSVCGRMKTTS